MRVILQEDIKGLGKKGDVVNVKDGYARNFLLPKKLAVEATETNINILNLKKEAEQAKKEKEIGEAKDLANKISHVVITIKAKAGEQGKLFGSITSKDIVEALKSQHNISLDKKQILLNDPLKTLGTKEIDVKIYEGITSKLKVRIEGED